LGSEKRGGGKWEGQVKEEKWEGRFERKWEVGGKKDEKGCGGKMRKVVEGEWHGVEVK
jgi:hypothetical protein